MFIKLKRVARRAWKQFDKVVSHGSKMNTDEIIPEVLWTPKMKLVMVD